MSAAAGDEDDEDDAVGFLEVTAGWQEPPWREAALFLQSIPGDIISPESIVSSQKKVVLEGGRRLCNRTILKWRSGMAQCSVAQLPHSQR